MRRPYRAFLPTAARFGQQSQDLQVQPDQRDHQAERAVPLHVLGRAAGPPSASPSSPAYTGAVNGDHSFFQIVATAMTSPPIAPSMIQGAATDGSSAART